MSNEEELRELAFAKQLLIDIHNSIANDPLTPIHRQDEQCIAAARQEELRDALNAGADAIEQNVELKKLLKQARFWINRVPFSEDSTSNCCLLEQAIDEVLDTNP